MFIVPDTSNLHHVVLPCPQFLWPKGSKYLRFKAPSGAHLGFHCKWCLVPKGVQTQGFTLDFEMLWGLCCHKQNGAKAK